MTQDIKKQFILQIDGVLEELKKNELNIVPFLPVISEKFHSSILTNTLVGGRWNGNANDIGLFSGGSNQWKPLSPYTIREYQKKGWKLSPTLDRTAGGLQSSIEVVPAGDSVRFVARKEYAAVHQYGAKIKQRLTPSIPVTKKSRKFFWAMYFETQDEKWKFMALSQKDEFTPVINRVITIPARPYLVLQDEDLDFVIQLLTGSLSG